MLKRLVKSLLVPVFWPVGSVRTIFWGQCRGLRYRIFPGYGFSPLYGGWEAEAQRLMVKHLQPGSVAYDVGANYGIHTLLMARLVRQAGHVYAFEPVPEIAASLEENLALNHLSNVTCVRSALGDRSGLVGFNVGHHQGAGHVAEADAADQTVAMTTLDEFVVQQTHRPPDFIKCDVEGFEGNVLRGSLATLRQYLPICLIDLHNPEQDRMVGAILLDLGYHVFRTEAGTPVKDLTQGWPASEGIWGQIIALPQKSAMTEPRTLS